MPSFRLTARLAAAALAIAPAAHAQTVVVTAPAVKTVAGARESDAPALDAWLRNNVGGGGSVGVSADYPRSGTGSAFMATTSSASKADLEYYFGGAVIAPFTLGSLSGASFDVFRDVGSSAAAHLHPSLRFFVDADGSMATTNDRGYLIYEAVYNGGGAVVEGAWTTYNIGASSNLWFRQFGPPGQTEEVFNRSLAAYQTGYTPTAGFQQLTGSSVVYGLSTGVGSGWGGTYTGAVDNVNVRYGQAGDVTFNFEVSAVPEPSTYALMGSGLLALAGVAARRRRANG